MSGTGKWLTTKLLWRDALCWSFDALLLWIHQHGSFSFILLSTSNYKVALVVLVAWRRCFCRRVVVNNPMTYYWWIVKKFGPSCPTILFLDQPSHFGIHFFEVQILGCIALNRGFRSLKAEPPVWVEPHTRVTLRWFLRLMDNSLRGSSTTFFWPSLNELCNRKTWFGQEITPETNCQI